ncbi:MULTISPECIES: hypothetical protein [Gluconobacter]|uniref:Lipoprotein n=2 Tax=Gluconobacter TaxID=441 RepID=A0A4Y3MB02_9PROT|nr:MULTISPECIES: hypothetical protein [Gluconobacter]KXV44638.1 hypothetical protein AD943_02960 [Gluconobacter roseus]MBF0859755.1 hypothetical protein [Gluconobacter vitians]GEB04548.1 hypothetical protein GRO01_21240 [Gluconobacter roseus NBRC 3990]GLP92316.1 hypothetical protein GCM10007871_02940 [Gluconobacter roseus NBRC 3990]
MKPHMFIMMILVGLAGCSHPRPQPTDSRSALLRPLVTSGSDKQADSSRPDHKIHGAVSVGTGFGSAGNYGVGPQSGLGSATGIGAGRMGLTPEGW